MYGIFGTHSVKITKETMNKIEISDAEAKKWLLFQEHYRIFDLLIEADVFVQRSAAVTLHFDNKGVLQTIERRDTIYSSRFPKISTETT